MTALADLRRQFPAYAAKTDQELAEAIYAKHYAAGPHSKGAVFQRLGVKTVNRLTAAGLGVADGATSNLTDELAGVGVAVAGNLERRDGGLALPAPGTAATRVVRPGDTVIDTVATPVRMASDALRARLAPMAQARYDKVSQALTRPLRAVEAAIRAPDAQTVQTVRDLQTRARTERPWSYYGAQVGSQLAAAFATGGANPAVQAPKAANVLGGFAAATAGGAMGGATSAYGDARGDAAERLQVAPAAAGYGAAVGGGLGLSALAAAQLLRGGAQGFRGAHAARTAAQAQRTQGVEAVAAAENAATRSQISDLAAGPSRALAASDVAAAERAAAEAGGAGPSALKALADRYGVPIARSQLDPAGDKGWLFEAQSGIYGEKARQVAQEIIARQYAAAPDALIRTLDDPKPRVQDAPSGAQALRDTLLARQAQEQEATQQLWSAFEDAIDGGKAQFRFSAKMPRGMADLRTAMSKMLDRERIDFARLPTQENVLFRSAAAGMRLLDELVERAADKPTTLEDLVSYRRSLDALHDNAATRPADQALIGKMRQALMQWTSQAVDRNVLRTNALPAWNALRSADQATSAMKGLFEDDRIVAKMTADDMDASRALDALIGSRGVRPQRGAHQTMEAIKARFGEDSEEWATLKETVVRRIADDIEAAAERGNLAGFKTAFNQLDELLSRHQEFVGATFTPAEQARLLQIRSLFGALQGPGFNPANPSRTGFALGKMLRGLIGSVPGAGEAADHLAALKAARDQMRAVPAAVGPSRTVETMRGAAAGALAPPSPQLSALASALAAQAQLRQDEARYRYKEAYR